MDNYDILYKILDRNSIVEYGIIDDNGDWLTSKPLSKNEAYDYLLENKLKIVDVSVYNDDFLLYVKKEG